MITKEMCLYCYQQRYCFSLADFTIKEVFEREWEHKILFCMIHKGMLGIRQGHFEEDMAGIAKAFASLPAFDCPYILEHTVDQ